MSDGDHRTSELFLMQIACRNRGRLLYCQFPFMPVNSTALDLIRRRLIQFLVALVLHLHAFKSSVQKLCRDLRPAIRSGTTFS